jgi:hypothetical protein
MGLELIPSLHRATHRVALELSAAEQALFEDIATDVEIILTGAAVEVVRADVLFVNVRPAAGADDEI